MLSVADQLIQQGFDKGLEKGLEQGRDEQRALLLRLLDRRFGAVPVHIAERVAAAPYAELERWFDRAIDAASLDDVFGNA